MRQVPRCRIYRFIRKTTIILTAIGSGGEREVNSSCLTEQFQITEPFFSFNLQQIKYQENPIFSNQYGVV